MILTPHVKPIWHTGTLQMSSVSARLCRIPSIIDSHPRVDASACLQR
jgi:hypothetical protein